LDSRKIKNNIFWWD